MFDDNEQDDIQAHLDSYRNFLERDFFERLRNNDIAIYLYLPPHLLTQKVRDELDKYLKEQAYVNLIMRNENLVYRDGMLDIQISDDSRIRSILNEMLNYFESIEEYEKCAKIIDKLNTLA